MNNDQIQKPYFLSLAASYGRTSPHAPNFISTLFCHGRREAMLEKLADGVSERALTQQLSLKAGKGLWTLIYDYYFFSLSLRRCSFRHIEAKRECVCVCLRKVSRWVERLSANSATFAKVREITTNVYVLLIFSLFIFRSMFFCHFEAKGESECVRLAECML